MIVIDDAEVRRTLSPELAVDAIREALAALHDGRLAAPPRVRAELGDGTLTFTAGRLAGVGYGFRVYDTQPTKDADQATVVFDDHGGHVLVVVTGTWFGDARTGAMGAVRPTLPGRTGPARRRGDQRAGRGRGGRRRGPGDEKRYPGHRGGVGAPGGARDHGRPEGGRAPRVPRRPRHASRCPGHRLTGPTRRVPGPVLPHRYPRARADGVAGRRPGRGGGPAGRPDRDHAVLLGRPRWHRGRRRRHAVRPRGGQRGGCLSTHPASRQLTSSQSTLGPPAAPVAVARTVLPPALSVAGTDRVCQVSQFAVAGKLTEVAGPPLTLMSIGRAAPLPLANRNASVALPAVVRLADHWMNPPTALT